MLGAGAMGIAQWSQDEDSYGPKGVSPMGWDGGNLLHAILLKENYEAIKLGFHCLWNRVISFSMLVPVGWAIEKDFSECGPWVPDALINGEFWMSIYSAAAAAKMLQSCLTLCNPINGSPPGSPVPGISKAWTLEWVAISFSNAWKSKVKVKSFSCVWLLATPWTVAYEAPLSMGFPRKEYWSRVPLPSLPYSTTAKLDSSHVLVN